MIDDSWRMWENGSPIFDFCQISIDFNTRRRRRQELNSLIINLTYTLSHLSSLAGRKMKMGSWNRLPGFKAHENDNRETGIELLGLVPSRFPFLRTSSSPSPLERRLTEPWDDKAKVVEISIDTRPDLETADQAQDSQIHHLFWLLLLNFKLIWLQGSCCLSVAFWQGLDVKLLTFSALPQYGEESFLLNWSGQLLYY